MLHTIKLRTAVHFFRLKKMFVIRNSGSFFLFVGMGMGYTSKSYSSDNFFFYCKICGMSNMPRVQVIHSMGSKFVFERLLSLWTRFICVHIAFTVVCTQAVFDIFYAQYSISTYIFSISIYSFLINSLYYLYISKVRKKSL